MYCSLIFALTFARIVPECVGVRQQLLLQRGPAASRGCHVNFTVSSFHKEGGIRHNATSFHREDVIRHDAQVTAKESQQGLRNNANVNVKGSQQEVVPIEEVDGSELSDILKEESLLVVFYAPWCPNCKVIMTGDNSAVIQINKVLQEEGGPRVVQYDTDQGKPPDALGFDNLYFVPTLYLAGKETGLAPGLREAYGGDPSDVQAVKAWVASHGMLNG